MANVWEPLEQEIRMIVNPEIQDFVKFALEAAPAYFWTDPASKSGRFHPTKSRGPGGIVHHTRLVVYFAMQLLESMGCEAWRDEIIAAALLHDAYKNGDGTTKYGVNWAMHGVNLAGHLKKQAGYGRFALKVSADKILDMCGKHMGKWGGAAPRPSAMEDWLLHIADMIASRKLVNIEQFDESKVP
jgi:23S rRNA maturation-related 3'-5' exoribonuclease YhaM